ncbi:hypothetical protein sos41_14850 [Alphaproteobacteria bacterium SO-S41]|nr:hypothetical protein sos41_14850 [Alphaproteobacteria bacterium SO-S41]
MLPKAGLGELIEKYAVFVNPIYPYIKRHPEVPQNFRTVDGIDYIGDKEVLFWHLQNNAADYLSRFFVLQNYGQSWWGEYLPVKLDLPFLQLRPSAENFAFQALRDYIVPKLNQHVREGGDLEALGFEKFFSRSWVSERFILDKMGRGIFSSAYWWEENIFV